MILLGLSGGKVGELDLVLALEPDPVSPEKEWLGLAQAIDRNREQAERLGSEWQRESAQLEILDRALDDELTRLSDRRAALRLRIESLESSQAATEELAKQTRTLESRVIQLTQELTRRLDRATKNSALAIQQIGNATENPAPSPVTELAAAFDRLAEAERRARTIARRRLSGLEPDGSRRAAEVLCLGGAAAWWLAPDGQAGVVRVEEGQLFFDSAHSEREVDAIREAFRVHAGEQRPTLLSLPIVAREPR